MGEEHGHAEEAGDAPENLGAVMSRLARQLQERHRDVEAMLQAITEAAIRTVPHADECGISYVVGRRKVEPRAWTGELPRNMDALQERLGQGPCMDAVWASRIVRVDDLRADGRWPRFAAEAGRLGVGSMVCLQLFIEGDNLGALNLYAHDAHAFDDAAQDVGLVFASHAAVALAGALHEEHLRRGMGTRDLIGQAKGILMERYKLSADQAFDVLARVSQEQNRKLVDVALEVTDTGAMTPPRGGLDPRDTDR